MLLRAGNVPVSLKPTQRRQRQYFFSKIIICPRFCVFLEEGEAADFFEHQKNTGRRVPRGVGFLTTDVKEFQPIQFV